MAGAGWGPYRRLLGIGIGDADRDVRPDLYAPGFDTSSASGVLYRGTGSRRVPFHPLTGISLFSGSFRSYDLFA